MVLHLFRRDVLEMMKVLNITGILIKLFQLMRDLIVVKPVSREQPETLKDKGVFPIDLVPMSLGGMAAGQPQYYGCRYGTMKTATGLGCFSG